MNLLVAGLARVDRVGYDRAEVAAGEQMLTGLARVFGPKDLHASPTGSWTTSTPTARGPRTS